MGYFACDVPEWKQRAELRKEIRELAEAMNADIGEQLSTPEQR